MEESLEDSIRQEDSIPLDQNLPKVSTGLPIDYEGIYVIQARIKNNEELVKLTSGLVSNIVIDPSLGLYHPAQDFWVEKSPDFVKRFNAVVDTLRTDGIDTNPETVANVLREYYLENCKSLLSEAGKDTILGAMKQKFTGYNQDLIKNFSPYNLTNLVGYTPHVSFRETLSESYKSLSPLLKDMTKNAVYGVTLPLFVPTKLRALSIRTDEDNSEEGLLEEILKVTPFMICFSVSLTFGILYVPWLLAVTNTLSSLYEFGRHNRNKLIQKKKENFKLLDKDKHLII